jgi:hypothetical protein
MAIAARSTLRRYFQKRWAFNNIYTDYIKLSTAVNMANASSGTNSPREEGKTKKEEQLEKLSVIYRQAKLSYEEFSQSLIVELDNYKIQRSLETRKAFYKYSSLQVHLVLSFDLMNDVTDDTNRYS